MIFEQDQEGVVRPERGVKHHYPNSKKQAGGLRGYALHRTDAPASRHRQSRRIFPHTHLKRHPSYPGYPKEKGRPFG